MLGRRIASQSEVIRAIVSGQSGSTAGMMRETERESSCAQRSLLSRVGGGLKKGNGGHLSTPSEIR